MMEKRETALSDPGASARPDLQWLELLAYAHGCCLNRADDTAAEAAPDRDGPLTEDAGVLH